ncbi:hypothetical protein BDR26DRAFT_863477 [Obelidium mucronatum]|nr:hypothetical protein BDR26DRAFT_863477 [Obelidium mucronatum]
MSAESRVPHVITVPPVRIEVPSVNTAPPGLHASAAYQHVFLPARSNSSPAAVRQRRATVNLPTPPTMSPVQAVPPSSNYQPLPQFNTQLPHFQDNNTRHQQTSQDYQLHAKISQMQHQMEGLQAMVLQLFNQQQRMANEITRLQQMQTQGFMLDIMNQPQHSVQNSSFDRTSPGKRPRDDADDVLSELLFDTTGPSSSNNSTDTASSSLPFM